MHVLVFALALAAGVAGRAGAVCLGPYIQCGSGDCVIFQEDCGKCGAGGYMCPLRNACARSADEYTACPGINGTHFDWNLNIERRIDYLLSQLDVQDVIAQLTNDAPAMPRVGLPSFQVRRRRPAGRVRAARFREVNYLTTRRRACCRAVAERR